MARREYKGAAVQTTLVAGITSSATSLSLAAYTGWPTGSFTMILDPGLAGEEKLLCTSQISGTVTITTRGYDDTTASAHTAGAVCYPAPMAKDFDEANAHIAETTTAHGLTLANLVKTTDTGVVTSTMILDGTIANADVSASAGIAYSKLNLTGGVVSADIANDTIMNADINTGAGIDWTKLGISSTVSSTEIGYVDGVTSAIQTQLDARLSKTGGTMSGAIAMGTSKITGMGDPTSAQDAATKAYTDLQITNLINGAGAAYDTLKELGDLLVSDESTAAALATTVAAKANSASPTFTGVPAAPTASVNTNTTQIATTAYVMAATVAPSNLTGPITSVGSATSIASQTGTGTKFVVDTSPTLVTPVLGVATATSINGTTIPSTKTLVVTTDKLSALAATTSAELAGVISDETGSGALVFGTSPSISGATETNLTLAGTLTAGGSAGTSGYVLSTTGTGVQWITAPSGLPSQTGNSGKYLTTNGTAASWAAITTDPNPQIFMLMGA